MKDIRSTKKVRQNRLRARLSGTSARPRLAVFRSLKHITAQVINDEIGKTLVAATDKELVAGDKKGKTPVEVAGYVGKLVGEKAKTKGIKEVVFDRGGVAYHGRVKALADSARESGLIF
ncbi:MAG: 50S ribosomal protein L18 [Patescibacteria group bacterium]